MDQPTSLRALIVDDNVADAYLLAFHLSDGGYEAYYERVDNAEAMRESLTRGSFDIVFCDFVLPRFSPQEALDLARELRPDLPFILMSGMIEEEGSAELLLAGADDFIAKGHYTRLVTIVRRSLAAKHARAHRGPATPEPAPSSPRRRIARDEFVDRLRRALTLSPAGPLTIVRLELNQFRRVSEYLGYAFRDALLDSVASRLVEALPAETALADLEAGGFALLARTEADAKEIAERLVAVLQRSFVVGEQAIRLSATFGIAVAETQVDTDALIRRAGMAVDRGRRTGAAIAVFNAHDLRAEAEFRRNEEFRLAVERGELVLHFQPQVRGEDLTPTGVEALVRWNHPAKGLLPPGAFVHLAAEAGPDQPMTGWVLKEALSQCRAWWMMGYRVPVSVNLTMADAQDPSLIQKISDQLRDFELPPGALVVELTEDTAITDPGAVTQTVQALHGLGVTVSIDDFGTGFATFTYLQRLPAQELKIDRSFIEGLVSHPADGVIVRAAIELAHQLGLVAVAEGVENEETWRRLRELGCDSAQGYWFARPMPFLDAARWLASRLPRDEAAMAANTQSLIGIAEDALIPSTEVIERQASRDLALRRETHNFELALDTALRAGDAQTALRLSTALRFFWLDNGRVDEGIDILRRALSLDDAQPRTPLRAGAMSALGVLLGQSGKLEEAHPLFVEAAEIQRDAEDRRGLAISLSNLATALDFLGRIDDAHKAHLESLALRRELGDRAGEGASLDNLAFNAYVRGDLAESRRFIESALALHVPADDHFAAAVVLDTLGAIEFDEGNLAAALAAYRRALELFARMSAYGDAAQPLAGIVMVAAHAGDTERALILAGAIEALKERQPVLPPINQARYDECRTRLMQENDRSMTERATVEGRSLRWEEVVRLARDFELPP